MKHEKCCGKCREYGIDGGNLCERYLICDNDCTCTPIESPEEKSECKGTCKVEGGWEERFEELNVHISPPSSVAQREMRDKIKYFLLIAFDLFKPSLKSFLRSELAKARQEERTQLLKEVGEKLPKEKTEKDVIGYSTTDAFREAYANGFNAALSAVKEVLSAEIKK